MSQNTKPGREAWLSFWRGMCFFRRGLRVLGLRRLRPAGGFLVDRSEVAALQDIVAVRLLANVVEDAMCFGVVMGRLCLIVAQPKVCCQQIMAPGKQGLH